MLAAQHRRPNDGALGRAGQSNCNSAQGLQPPVKAIQYWMHRKLCQAMQATQYLQLQGHKNGLSKSVWHSQCEFHTLLTVTVQT